MADLESVFIKDFTRRLRGVSAYKNIYEVPLPEVSRTWGISGSEIYGIKGIGDEGGLFSKLNKTLVKRLPKGVVSSRRKTDIVTRDFARDKEGKIIYEDVKIPKGSMVIISKVNLNLPYKYKTVEEGFGYIDFVMSSSGKEFLYYIPKKYLYLTNQTALALSVKNMKNYSGMGYVSWRFGTIYLHIIPYKPNQKYVGSKILKTSHTLNFTNEVRSIIDYWIQMGIIPDVSLCNTISKGNLALKETSRGYDCYEPIEDISLGEKEIYGYSIEDDES